MSLHFQRACAVERRNLRPGGRIGQRKHRVACVEMVRAKSSPSRIGGGKFGPGIRASSRKEIFSPNFRSATAQDQESTRVDDPYYNPCYHKVCRAIAGVAHFLLLKKEHSKDWGTSPGMIWGEAPEVTTEMTKCKSPRP